MLQSDGSPIFKKILVIDDNEIDRFIAKRVIEKYKFCEELVLKESAYKALEYLRELENTIETLPQLIFLDIRMPEMDGFGFIEEYAKLPESIKSNCVIMMLSTSLDPEDHNRAQNNIYVNRFLNKPLSIEKIEEFKRDFLNDKL